MPFVQRNHWGGYSLDVLEIDGASHRGIEDIRQINETIGYVSSGKYKIYLIDEVHMLTKEAFNALLKSLEEPPAHVKFFFATTEPNQIPLTILSRCQRLNFRRVPQEKIVGKLSKIASELNLVVDSKALDLLAKLAEGGLRDAESLFDELVSYQKEHITEEGVRELFGLPEEELFFKLDQAGKALDYTKAFEVVDHLFASGKNILAFLDGLTEHFRALFLKKTPYYTQEQLLKILNELSQAQQEIKQTPSKRTFLELLLLRILDTHKQLSLEGLVSRLEELERKLGTQAVLWNATATPATAVEGLAGPSMAVVQDAAFLDKKFSLEKCSESVDCPSYDVGDPSLGLSKQDKETGPRENFLAGTAAVVQDVVVDKPVPKEGAHFSLAEKSRFDTLMRFAAKELNGSLK